MSRYRRRSLVLGALALVLLLAVAAGAGRSSPPPPVAMRQVVLVRRPVTAGGRIVAADLAVSAMPASWASPHQLGDPAAAVGRRATVDLAAGALLMDAELAEPGPEAARDLSLRLDDAAGLPLEPVSGGRADLYLIRAGRPRVQLVIAGLQVVAARSQDGVSVATVRVRAADVAVLIAAEAAGGLRLVARGGGGGGRRAAGGWGGKPPGKPFFWMF